MRVSNNFKVMDSKKRIRNHPRKKKKTQEARWPNAALEPDLDPEPEKGHSLKTYRNSQNKNLHLLQGLENGASETEVTTNQ